MAYTKLITWMIILFHVPVYLFSQIITLPLDFASQKFTTIQGLPDNQIFDMVEHRDGFVYLLTRSGITRWDGFGFITFPTNDPSASWNSNSMKLTAWGDHYLAIILGGANYYLAFDTRTGKFEQHKFPVPKAIHDPISWNEERIVYAVNEANQTAIWEMTVAGSVMRMILPFSTDELNGFEIVGNRVWWNNNGQFRWLDLTTCEIKDIEFCHQPEQTSTFTAGTKHFFFKIAADTVAWCELIVSQGLAKFYLWNQADNCFKFAGTYSNPFPDADFYGLKGIADRSGHIMFTNYFLGQASDSGYKNVLYEIKNGELVKLWEGAFTSNINYPVSVPPARDFRQGFFSLSSNGFTKLIGKGSAFRLLLHNEQEAVPMRGITGDGSGNFWFATDLKGLFNWDSRSDRIRKIRFNQPRLQKLVYQKNLLFDEKGYLWTCESDSKFLKIDTASLEVEEFPIGRVRNFLYHRGLIWYTNETDLLLHLDPETGKSTSVFKQFFPKRAYGTTYVHDLKQGKKSGNLLICSSEGLHEYNPETRKLRPFRTDSPLGNNLPTHHFLTIYEDESGIWWLGTNDHGLVRFNATTGETKVYDTKAGLCNNRVVSILPDARGRLWLGTFTGLSCFNPEEQLFENFYKIDGLCHTEFNRLSAFQSDDGRMFFGTVNGVNIFHPDDALHSRANEGTFPLLSAVDYFDKKQGAVTLNFWDGSPIQLGADNRRISVKIASAYPSVGNQVRFAYLMEGFSDNWVYLPEGQRQIQFEYLPAGRFTLRVKCSNGMGEWSKKELAVPIRVQAFFYQTWWFFLLVLGVLSFSVFWFYRMYSKQKLASQRASDLEELDTLKSRLFTSITHEFRTPLTLILGPVQTLLRRAGSVSTGELVSSLTHVQNNGQRLLGLINQILDLQKLEAGQMLPNYEQGDIMSLLQYLTDSFHSMADAKHLQLGFTGHPQAFLMDFDKEKLTKIVVNILTNAIKFTPEGGEVRLTAKGEASFWLEVRDTGIGIRQENLDNIFDLFYQVDNSNTRRGEGTGIGLTLVKELTELMGGHISVSSEEGKGTCFRVELPVKNEAPVYVSPVIGFEMQNLEATTPFSFLPSENRLPSSAPLVLLVEDNPDVSAYIGSCLGSEYRIEYAYNGKAGMEKAIELVPDLVISDVMMPEADGFEVCRFLKNDTRTSHIPVVLLTARANIQDKLEGLRRGADAYLAKPFYEEELLITVEKLLRLRQTLQERYATITADAGEGRTSMHTAQQESEGSFDLPKEDAFMEQVVNVIQRHLDDAGFSVEQLTREVGMSNTQLFRKLKALTDLSANQLIRRVRLERAKELLNSTNLTVAEIAYQTGFTDPSYFTRIFVREVGVQPTEFRRE